MNNKPWYKSRTIWFNFGTFLTGVGTLYVAMVDYLPEEWRIPTALSLVFVNSTGNLILRTVTNSGIK